MSSETIVFWSRAALVELGADRAPLGDLRELFANLLC